MPRRADPTNAGTEHRDRMRCILACCRKVGILETEERVTYRDGTVEAFTKRLVNSTGRVRETPQYFEYGLSIDPKVLRRFRDLRDEFANDLNVASVSIVREGDVWWVRIPRERTTTLTFTEAWEMHDIPVGSLLLGVSSEGRQLRLNITSPSNVHCAVIGMTGSGKSTLMQTMALSAQLIGGARIALLDPRRGLLHLSGHPSVLFGGLITAAEDIERALRLLVDGEHGGGTTYVFVDEVPELVRSRPDIGGLLVSLATTGRHNDIHLVLGSQHSVLADFPCMGDIPTRLVGRVGSVQQSYQACRSRPGIGCERLRGSGDFVAIAGASEEVVRFQAATPVVELVAWTRQYPPRMGHLPEEPTALPVVKAQAVMSSKAIIKAAPEPEHGARAVDDLPVYLVDAARRHYCRFRQWPADNQIDRWIDAATRGKQKHIRRPKARRICNAAARRIGMILPYPQYEADYQKSVVVHLEVAE